MKSISNNFRRRRRIKVIYPPFIALTVLLLICAQMAWVQEEMKPEKGYIVGSADEYEENEKDGLIIFRGNVKMLRENGYLYADVVTVHRDPETGDVLKTIAEGHVDMKDGDLMARCEKAVLDEVNDIIELTGSVVVTRGSDKVEAPYVKYNRKTGRRIGKGGVKFKVQLKEEKKEEKKKEQ
jgi:lipopolysaccharide transport protein LptA